MSREERVTLPQDTFVQTQHIRMGKKRQLHINKHKPSLASPCGLVVDETLLKCVRKALVNQRVADEGSSLAQRGFQLTIRNTHSKWVTQKKGQTDDTSQQLCFSTKYLEKVVTVTVVSLLTEKNRTQ